MEYIKYEKTFVMLAGQNEDFALRPGSPVKGHIKIETGNNKGAMRIGVQNLRYFDKKDYVYKLILFGKRTERTIHAIIGTVSVNRYGSGETYFRFDPKDLEGKGYALSDFFYAIVAAVSVRNEKEPLHPVLKGILEFSRREEKRTSNKENDSQETVKAAGVPDHKSPAGSSPPEDAGNGSETQEEGRDYPDVDTEAETLPEPARQCYNSYYNQFLLDNCRRLSGKAEFYDDVKPFHIDETGASWKKIVNVNNFPLISPGGRYFATKYRHYLFGSDNDRYYFGVPGRFLREEQPEEGRSGFVFWQPLAGAEKLRATEADCPEENRKTAYGYWIVAVDKETGDILEV